MIFKATRRFALATLLATGVATAAMAADEHYFRMATGWTGGPLMDIGSEAFARRVAELSGGRIEIEVFPGGTLGPALSVSETVQQGVADMGHTWMGWDWGADPTTVLFGGYAGSFDTERMLHWLYRAGGAELQNEYRMDTMGLVSMPLFIRTAEVFLHSRKPVRSLEDLAGLRIRTAGAWLEMARTLGAAPVTMPGSEVYPALERGVVDAVEWGTLWENIANSFHQVAPYLIIPGVHQPTAPFELVINKTAWDSLSPEDQDLIRTAAFLTTMESWLTIGQEDAKALQFYRDAGVEIIDLDPEVQYQTREVGLEWARGVAATNPWFKRVFEHQVAFEELWKDARRYRNVLVKSD